LIDYVLTGVIGNGIRLTGVLLALLSAYLVWVAKTHQFSDIKGYLSVAIFFEGMYFLSLLPISTIGVFRWRAPVLMIGFVLQILLVSPVLTFFSLKIWRYTEPVRTNLLKWGKISAISYLIGIWINNVFRWFSMTSSTGIQFLLTGITSLGFLSTIVTLSFALILAVAGINMLPKKKGLGTKMLALALIVLGLHFVIYILYSAYTNILSYVILVEIWPITLLGLGLSMLRNEI
jgi:hypothetical protein